MDQKILVFAGPKQSGKDSGANFVAGYVLTQLGRRNPDSPIPVDFQIDEFGKLLVNTDDKNFGVLDLNNNTPEFLQYASHYIWPYVKTYAFADTLKEIAVIVFGLTREQVYGTDDDKNTLTNIRWQDMCAFLPPRTVGNIKKSGQYKQNMTAREFLQYFGTNVCRKLYDGCWVDATFNRIKAEGYPFCIITDGRFENEVLSSKKNSAKIIKLNRTIYNDGHASEVGLKKVPNNKFNLIIDNNNMNIRDKNQKILDALSKWGWVGKYIEKQEQVFA
jgi:hypothetical protein